MKVVYNSKTGPNSIKNKYGVFNKGKPVEVSKDAAELLGRETHFTVVKEVNR